MKLAAYQNPVRLLAEVMQNQARVIDAIGAFPFYEVNVSVQGKTDILITAKTYIAYDTEVKERVSQFVNLVRALSGVLICRTDVHYEEDDANDELGRHFFSVRFEF